MADRDPLFTVVTYYTSDYKGDAARLAVSLADLDIPKYFDRIATRGSWQANIAYKPEFLWYMRRKLKGPIVWIDADAIVRSYPHEFDDLADIKKISPNPFDLAVHYRRGKELLSGTIWINDTHGAREIIRNWWEAQGMTPDVWDQKTLAAVIRDFGQDARIYDLPAAYTFIFDLMKTESPDVEPVIEHFQASRKARRRERINPYPETLF